MSNIACVERIGKYPVYSAVAHRLPNQPFCYTVPMAGQEIIPDTSDKVNVSEAIAHYIEEWTPDRRSRIKAIQAGIDNQPLGNDLQAYVIIPVAAGEEGKVLQRTFAQYAQQDMPPNQWAILFYVNTVGKSNQNKLTGTTRLLNELAHDFPSLPARITSYVYSDKQSIGQIRSDAWDCALLDINHKKITPALGISNDADSVDASPNYISTLCRAAEEYPGKDMFNCALTYGVEGDSEWPVNRILKYWEYTAKAQRIHQGRIGMSDGNAAIRIGTYVEVNGFNTQNKMGEMGELRRDIARLRHGLFADADVANSAAYQDVIKFVPGIEMATDSRRVYAALAQGLPPEYAWTYVPFGTDSDPTRTADTLSLARTELAVDVQQYILDEIDKSHFKDIDPTIALDIILAERKKLHLSLPASDKQ